MVSRKRSTFTYLLLIGLSFSMSKVEACIRRPPGASGSSSPVDDSFRITIDGNPATYIPGQVYNVTLSCDIAFKFISFTLVVETEPGTPYGLDMSGHFDLIDAAETRFSNLCENMIESSNTNFKHRVDVAWVAPTNPNSTCVYLKAAVLQHRSVWYIDDGFLTKRICPEEIDDVNSQTPEVNPCCACDEAKYELVLERRWMRNTHAKDFPEDDWRTRFSELLGASHSYNYRFWAYGSPASPGLKDLAEYGATKKLENEIKDDSETGAIRTIIKAPGVGFRKNVVSSTLATVRVDPRHHMVSFVTKIIPSPDWILGVARLELCLANCTWVKEKVLNLFPWDVGTDSGASYMDPDQQQVPADVIRRITSTFPSDPRSPFYDETGAPMKPMATLYMTRKKLYERECDVDDNAPAECATHPWVEWTECSTKCGAGNQYRERSYKDIGLAARYNCQVELSQTRDCVGTQCGLQEEDEIFGQSAAECELTNWSNWGPCSRSCGRGFMKRTRDYRNPYARENCQAGIPVELEQTKECLGNACGGTINRGYGNDNNDFDQYSREPGILEEDEINTNYNRNNQYSRQRKPSRVNERWDAGEDNLNRQPTFGDIDQNGNGINNYRNKEQQATNFGYGSDNNNYRNTNFEQNSFANNNEGDTFGYTNNERNSNMNPTSNRNEFWMGGNGNNRADNQSPYENNMDNNFNSGRGDPFNGDSNNDAYQNGQDPYEDLNENNSNNYNAMQPPVYNQQSASERVTNRYSPKSTRFPNGRTDSFDNTNSRNAFGRKTAVTSGTALGDYTVVQRYCFYKPVVVRKVCKGKKISNFWFFDAEDGECKLFTTDSCDENKNKFFTIESCEGTCLQPQLNFQQQQHQQTQPEQNNWANQFGAPQSQIRPTKAYGNIQQNRNQMSPPRRTNRIFYIQ